MSQKNKAIVVPGGNSGIGKVIVLELAGQGANIATEYVSHPDATDKLAKQIAPLGDQAIGLDRRSINITSVLEDWPLTGSSSDCVSKASMRMLTRTAGVELAPHNILAAGVGPGVVATPINLSTMQIPQTSKLDSAITLAQMDPTSEIGGVVAVLAGSGANHIQQRFSSTVA